MSAETSPSRRDDDPGAEDGLFRLRLGHSPDPDDAFMWWAATASDDVGRPPLDTGRYRFEAVASDIESLNERSVRGDLEITGISAAQYPHVARRYRITACGSSFGERYGPRLVARAGTTLADLRERPARVAIPGRRTTAFLLLNLALGPDAVATTPVSFETVIDRVASGEFDAGVVIHEGQLTFGEAGLNELLDLGRWWHEETRLPLPLGLNVVRRDLDRARGEGVSEEIAALLRRSIETGMSRREEAVRYAMRFARGVDFETALRFVDLYANDRSLDMGNDGEEALETLFARAAAAGLAPDAGAVDVLRA